MRKVVQFLVRNALHCLFDRDVSTLDPAGVSSYIDLLLAPP